MPVRLIRNGRPAFAVTEDLSMSGLRVRSDARPRGGDVARLEIHLPEATRLVVPASVVHVRHDADSEQPAIGLELAELEAAAEQTWRRVVDRVRAISPLRKLGEHINAVVPLYPSTPSAIANIQLAARGGKSLFAPTALRARVGEHVQLLVVHPGSRNLFSLQARVTELVGDDKRPGLHVELTPLDIHQRAAMSQFISCSRERRSFTHTVVPRVRSA